MNYFYLQKDIESAIDRWNNSQFDLSDIVLSLTDNGIFQGVKIYAIFSRKEILAIMRYFVCDFYKIKQELGIVGNYVDRFGNVFDKNYNPKRNKLALTLNDKQMKIKAIGVYKKIILDLEEIGFMMEKFRR